MEGPNAPAGPAGEKCVLNYMCSLCQGALLEPCVTLSASEARRAFARCLCRSGTIPRMLRSDRGSEFRNSLLREYCALLGTGHVMGAPWRAMEQGKVERNHQDLQKLMGILAHDVVCCRPAGWPELLPALEFPHLQHSWPAWLHTSRLGWEMERRHSAGKGPAAISDRRV